MVCDSQTLSAHFAVLQRYLRNNPRGYVSQESREYGINRAWLNYLLNGSRSDYKSEEQNLRQTRLFTSLNSGVNIGPWHLRDYSTLTKGRGESRLTHVRSWLQRDLPPYSRSSSREKCGTRTPSSNPSA